MFAPPLPSNEPVKSYAPGSAERAALQAELERQAATVVEIPCVVGGQRHYTGQVVEVTMPCEHGHVLARAHMATPELVARSLDGVTAAQRRWAALPWQERAAVFLKAADLLAGPWRARMNAATMLGQSKTSHQAEIDAACEIIDFWRYNAAWVRQVLSDQPGSGPGMWNRTDHRPLEGYVFALTPFNFTSIALNLPTAPALMGNVVVWKPATTQLLSAWVGYELFEAAGLPAGVIDFLPGRGASVGDPVMADPRLAGLHFTGSTGTFNHLWRTVAHNLERYRAYPRLVGETGGKDFILAHESADVDALAVAIVRGGFEYQGQKCSAASRVYVPDSLWPQVRERVVGMMQELKQGDVRDWGTFVGAVIDRKAWQTHKGYLELAHGTARVVQGGETDDRVGWFVQPTLVQVEDPKHRLMQEEIFGPVVTTFVYPAARWTEALELVDGTSPYALTGAVFARDRYAVEEATGMLRHAAGNFYVNDKPTGAVVGQQPFGGARQSGTNDKAGSVLNLLRWVSPRTIKETFVPPTDWRYPYLG
ncbi:L-glutamate gamma-semialdehyde dehydrogenase [Myxococcota bacterium]|nr:L-glutamate gamma-semialdehyde dehydrogenase [Myxococcota bacterium]